jgi:hypothetical protein
MPNQSIDHGKRGKEVSGETAIALIAPAEIDDALTRLQAELEAISATDLHPDLRAIDSVASLAGSPRAKQIAIDERISHLPEAYREEAGEIAARLVALTQRIAAAKEVQQVAATKTFFAIVERLADVQLPGTLCLPIRDTVETETWEVVGVSSLGRYANKQAGRATWHLDVIISLGEEGSTCHRIEVVGDRMAWASSMADFFGYTDTADFET